jgi:LuxR family maltose regulon positive regulatory protein
LHERRDPVPRARPIPAIRARIRIAQGRLDDVGTWASGAGISVDGDLSYLAEFQHVTLARFLIAQHSRTGDRRRLDEAFRLLERLHVAAQTGGRIGSVIEISVLEAIAQHALGTLRPALDHLGTALALAEPEGFLRAFVEHGIPVRDLLRHSIARGLSHSYARTVLAAFDGPKQPVSPVSLANTGAPAQPTELTSRELEILRLIGAGLRNQEIADHLSISGATVKRHIANAYGKLGAGHRTEALVRAKELKLL